jgi:metallo-beta-lactamase class B
MVHPEATPCGLMAAMARMRVGDWGWVAVVFGMLFLLVARTGAANPADWTTPVAPFRIADGLYYVGSKDLASYLVVTAQGDVLINSSLEASAPLIQRSVEQLGFRMTDISILLISHAHSDHDAGSAALLKITGAKYMVMDGDAAVVESGGAKDFAYPNDRYPEAKVDRVLHDGDEVRLGGAVLVAHKTAGHTRGCTTWTMRVPRKNEGSGKPLDVVIVGGWNVNPRVRLVDQPGKNGKPGRPASYPGIAADYEKTFVTLKSLPCDIFLGAHGQFFGMLAKLARAKGGAGESVWVDPEGYNAEVADREVAFEAELKRQEGGR